MIVNYFDVVKAPVGENYNLLNFSGFSKRRKDTLISLKEHFIPIHIMIYLSKPYLIPGLLYDCELF